MKAPSEPVEELEISTRCAHSTKSLQSGKSLEKDDNIRVRIVSMITIYAPFHELVANYCIMQSFQSFVLPNIGSHAINTWVDNRYYSEAIVT